MDELRLRQRICQVAQQLWMRGLIVGDAGLVTAELHRRRFLVTPPGQRRAHLLPEDIICVDMGGREIQGGTGLDETRWQSHRAAYKTSLDDTGQPRPGATVKATIFSEPPLVLALLRLAPADRAELALPGCDPIPVLDAHDEQAVIEAVGRSPLLALRSEGVLAAAESVEAAINLLERADHAARIALASGIEP